MSDPILHIKDAYYFDVPKFLWRSDRSTRDEFPEWWVRLDDDYQQWEAGKLYDALATIPEPKTEKPLAPIPAKQELISTYEHWKHADHARAGIPFDRYLTLDKSQQWYKQRSENPAWLASWKKAQPEAAQYKDYSGQWGKEKLAQYNQQMHGKVLIPQPFGGRPKNLYEPAEGFVISKFMIIELVVAMLLVALFVRAGSKIRSGERPRGRITNLLEGFLVFIRDQVARPAIGKHDADRFLPLLWTIFFFVLGCNLFGMLPWAGAPTAAFGVTLALAGVTLAAVFVSGMARFGIIGFWKNQIPHMDLPWYMAVLIIPPLFVIEVVGLFIKHAVLAVRLLANMVAGHLVLLGIMGLALVAAELSTSAWAGIATASIIGSALFSVMELFVAFLQAFVFTLLSALFIGAAVHHH
ncbi:MAG: F0F1 ATP synthase subunit A [Planctomycetes bacterium]|nr:F0F1 ATP synthase subunit A [Planctomycetota bacterium]